MYSPSSASAFLPRPLTEPVFSDDAEAATAVSASIPTVSVADTVTSVPETVLVRASITASAAPLTRFIATRPETARELTLAALAAAVTSLLRVEAIVPDDSAVALTAPVAVTRVLVMRALACAVAGLPRLVPTRALRVSKPRLLLS